MHQVLLASLVLSLIAPILPASEHERPAWQSMRVVPLKHYPSDLHMVQTSPTKQSHGLLLNRRKSAVTLVRYLPPDKRVPLGALRRPNDPPMVPEVAMDETTITGLPMSVVSVSIPNIGQRVVILSGPKPRLNILKDVGNGPLEEERVIELLPGRLLDYIPVAAVAGGEYLLIAFREGIQRVALEPNREPEWLSPKERLAIQYWDQVDLDGDKVVDLVDWGRERNGEMTLRWKPLGADGTLGLRQSLRLAEDLRADDYEIFHNPEGPAHVVALPSNGAKDLRVYGLTRGEEHELGSQQQLSLPTRGHWTGMTLGNTPSLVLADKSAPRLLVWTLGADGFTYRDAWPGVSKVRALVSAQDRLFILRDNAADLLVSYWQNERLTFPATWDESPDGNRRILHLERVGSEVWWVRKLTNALELHRWHDSAAEPVVLKFKDMASKAEKVRWLGGSTLMVQDKFSAKTRLLQLADYGSVTQTTPAHLAKADFSQFTLIDAGNGEFRPARMVDGAMQWLDEEGQAVDQVMLGDGAALTALHMIDGENALALETGGERIHRLQVDTGGVLRTQQSFDMPGGRDLIFDPVLGLIFDREQQLMRLGVGAPWGLALKKVIDYLPGEDLADAGIHRLRKVDLNGDGRQELVVFDHAQHRVTAYRPTHDFSQMISWQVFSDEQYPYGYRDDELRAEPRLISAGDFDGDGKQDLFLVSHDRLLIYLAKKEEEIRR